MIKLVISNYYESVLFNIPIMSFKSSSRVLKFLLFVYDQLVVVILWGHDLVQVQDGQNIKERYFSLLTTAGQGDDTCMHKSFLFKGDLNQTGGACTSDGFPAVFLNFSLSFFVFSFLLKMEIELESSTSLEQISGSVTQNSFPYAVRQYLPFLSCFCLLILVCLCASCPFLVTKLNTVFDISLKIKIITF